VTPVEYFFGPLLVLAFVGVLVLLLRWAFSRGDSLVRRADRPADPDRFGLLTDVQSAPSYAEARKTVEALTRARIKATAARTTQGWTVYVWPADVDAAYDVIRSLQQ
jgi:hypothetical protein